MVPASPDLTGIALVLGAGTAFTTGVGGIILQIIVVVRQGRQLQAMNQLHDSVNGQTKELKDLIHTEAFGAGKAEGTVEGAANERARTEGKS
jgi:hypothetical protein